MDPFMTGFDEHCAFSVPVRYKPFASRDDELGPLHYDCAQGVQHHVPYDWEQKTTSRKMREGGPGRKGGNEHGHLYQKSAFSARSAW